MNYWELRNIIKSIIPRQQKLIISKQLTSFVEEKGRKSNYQQFNLQTKSWQKKSRLLKVEEIKKFLYVSRRAHACPMPLNMDVWNGLHCPHCCMYCYADYFRSSLYSSFFDNYKTLKLRHCNSKFYMKEMDKLFLLRGEINKAEGEVEKAIAMNIPIRFGIQFDNFHEQEYKQKISLGMLKYLANNEYPTMINTKSYVIGLPEYVKALADNPAGTAVHITLISSDEELLKKMEPGAPTFKKRIETIKQLTDAGIRVVARIEPYMIFINDKKDAVYEYIDKIIEAGVKNLTFDTYSYSAKGKGIRNNFDQIGYDFKKMFLLTSDSQPIGSLLLGKFMELFRKKGLSVSTFDCGNIPTNSQSICCEVGDIFTGFNHGSMVMAVRLIKNRKKPTHWKHFESYVNKNGGFLSDSLRIDIKKLWNCEGNIAFSIGWGVKIRPLGRDDDGIIWEYKKESIDYREKILEGLI